jgi:hypothetical protein
VVALPSHLLGPWHRPLPPLPRSVQRRHAPSRTAGAHRPPGLEHPLERPQSGPSPWTRCLPLSRPVGLQGRACHQPPRLAQGPHGHFSLSYSGPCTPTHRPPRRHRVAPPGPPARRARWLEERPPLRLAACQRCPRSRHAPPDERAGMSSPHRWPADADRLSCTGRPLVSDLWRAEAGRQAPVDFHPGVGRDKLSGSACTGRASRGTGGQPHSTRAS